MIKKTDLASQRVLYSKGIVRHNSIFFSISTIRVFSRETYPKMYKRVNLIQMAVLETAKELLFAAPAAQ